MFWINKVTSIASTIFVPLSSEPTSATRAEMWELVDDWSLCFLCGIKQVKSGPVSKSFAKNCKKYVIFKFLFFKLVYSYIYIFIF